ncbi:MAG: class I SAM-dependent methyltransferase [Acetatifactor sp.]|jgi:SAM-dependent methyltransferase|uniref:Class I SAM-dependent methyltransferase n=1 Tax=Anaerobutyricum soehngenii TaxID=105843 RepID=A0A6N7Y2Q8_9FIRM|nr:class I SAM-dependent methyltransferase [Anaerobutyricum soehngenii]MSU82172.1 class I SAM-dependent methyltransferase [Anaerobutyricum soehngenii]
MDYTIDYYNQNAKNFIENTQNVDMHLAQDKFLQLLDSQSSILDFGCGSGRDTKYFLEKGYHVTATDGSAELCKLASAFTGIEVKEMLFQELDDINKYDGIWACSSILHLPKKELFPVLRKMCIALKSAGVIYSSFKYGDFEGERNGRYFTDFTEDTFRDFIKDIPELTIEDHWITSDVRPGRGNEKWLNLIIRKSDIL